MLEAKEKSAVRVAAGAVAVLSRSLCSPGGETMGGRGTAIRSLEYFRGLTTKGLSCRVLGAQVLLSPDFQVRP